MRNDREKLILSSKQLLKLVFCFFLLSHVNMRSNSPCRYPVSIAFNNLTMVKYPLPSPIFGPYPKYNLVEFSTTQPMFCKSFLCQRPIIWMYQFIPMTACRLHLTGIKSQHGETTIRKIDFIGYKIPIPHTLLSTG